jgi:hypothetical protein
VVVRLAAEIQQQLEGVSGDSALLHARAGVLGEGRVHDGLRSFPLGREVIAAG